MLLEILLGIALAGLLLVLTGWLYSRCLRHLPASGWLVLTLKPGQEARLEQQLQALAYLRQRGELRTGIVLLSDGIAPEQARFVQNLRRQALVDEVQTLAAFTRRMELETRQEV